MPDWGFAQVDQQWYNTPALLADAERMYTEVKTLQPKYWRIGAAWSLIAKQKDPGTTVAGTPPTTTGRDWTTLDTSLNEAILLGSEVVLIVGVQKAAWGGFQFGPFSFGATMGTPTDFANWCVEVANRYKPGGNGIRTDGRYAPNAGKGVRIFEVWNEQNDQNHWGGQISPNDYTNYLNAAYSAIKSVTGLTGTPTPGTKPSTGQSLILFGGTYHVQRIGSWLGYGVASLPEVEFLNACYTYGALWDAMAIHVYPHLDTEAYNGADVGPVPTMNIDNMRQLTEIRTLMVAKGDGAKKIWITEAGFPCSNVTEAQQNTYWQTLWGLFSALTYVETVLFYCARDGGTDPKVVEATWGAMRYDFTHKPVWSWLQTLSPRPSVNAVFTATSSLSATVSRRVVATFTATSSFAAYTPPRVGAAFTATSGMSALADLPGFRNADFTTQASMAAAVFPSLPVAAQFSGTSSFTATVKPSVPMSVSFTATATMAATAGLLNADFAATATLSATIAVPVLWVATGNGGAVSGSAATSKTATWTDNIATSGTDVWVFAEVGFTYTGAFSFSAGCSYGGTTMSLIGVDHGSTVATAIFGLQNPPTGAKTGSVTLTGLSGAKVAIVDVTSNTYKQVGSVGTPVSASGNSATRSLTTAAVGGARVIAVSNSVLTTLGSVSANNRTPSGVGFVVMQDASSPTGFVTFTVAQNSASWRMQAVPLNPA